MPELRKLSFKETIALIGSIFGVIGSTFGAYMYLQSYYVPREIHEKDLSAVHVRIDNSQDIQKNRVVEMDLKITELELNALLKIKEEDLTPADKHRIKLLTAKEQYLEEHLFK